MCVQVNHAQTANLDTMHLKTVAQEAYLTVRDSAYRLSCAWFGLVVFVNLVVFGGCTVQTYSQMQVVMWDEAIQNLVSVRRSHATRFVPLFDHAPTQNLPCLLFSVLFVCVESIHSCMRALAASFKGTNDVGFKFCAPVCAVDERITPPPSHCIPRCRLKITRTFVHACLLESLLDVPARD